MRHLFLFIFFPLALLAQENISVQGQLVDAVSGDPLPLGYISIGDQAAVADDNGVFLISSPEGTFSFTVQFIGYVKMEGEITVSEDMDPLIYRMIPDENMLEDMVLSDNKYAQRYEKSTIAIDVIRPETLTKKSPDNIQRSIEQLPSVHMIGEQINIRGGAGWTYGAGTRVQFLQDGVPMLDAARQEIQWYLIEPLSVDQIEVVKGASSVLDGSSALNGSINVTTRKPTKDLHVAVSSLMGIYDGPKRKEIDWYSQRKFPLSYRNLSFYGDKKIGKWELSSGFNTYRDQHVVRNNVPNERLRIFEKVAFDNDRGLRLGASATYIHNVEGEAFLNGGDSAAYLAFDDVVYDFETHEYALRPFLTYQKEGSKWSHEFNGQFLHIEFVDTVTNQSRLYYSNFQSQYRNKRWTWTLGASGSLISGESEAYNIKADQAMLGAFSQVEYSTGRFTAIGGLRVETGTAIDTQYVFPIKRLALNYALSDDLFLKASYGEAVRLPSLFELSFQRDAGEIQFFPNLDLQPEVGFSTELGFVYKDKIGLWNLLIEWNAFYMQYENMTEVSFGIWGDSTSTNSLNPLGVGFTEVNIGRASVLGNEINIRVAGKVGKTEIQAGIGYTYMDPTIADKDNVYASYSDREEALKPLISEDLHVFIPAILQNIGSDVSYRSTSADSDILKYRFRHLANADIQATFGRWSPSINVRYYSAMENIDNLFESYLFNEEVEDAFSTIENLAGLDLNIDNFDILAARERDRNGTVLCDIRLGYQTTKNWSFQFAVENVFNTEQFIRPAEIGLPRRFSIQADFRL